MGAALKFAAVALLAAFAIPAGAADYRPVGGGAFESVLRYTELDGAMKVAPFLMRTTPVTNAEFAAFVEANPAWRRGQVPELFAESRYLEHWPTTHAGQPVTHVSWFAAEAFCEWEGGRLPSFTEWEFASAADETRTDARKDPAWRARILDWYARPSDGELPDVMQGAPNAYGLHDLHGLVWEWVEDHAALLVSSDNREQGDPDLMKFCGAGALSMRDRENYAVLMRVAMLSALEAHDVTRNLGFRCVKDQP